MTEPTLTLILVIDDEKVIRESYRNYLEDFGYRVLEAENGKKGIALFDKSRPDLVLVDLRMPEMDGLEVLKYVKKNSPSTPVVVSSGTGVLSDIVEAIHEGAWDYLMKPVDMSVFMHSIENVLEKAMHIKEKDMYSEHLENEVARRTADLKRTTNALQKSVEKYEFLAGNLKDLVISFLPDGTIDYCSSVIFEFGGYRTEEVTGSHISRYIAGKSGQEQVRLLLSSIAKEQLGRDWEFIFRPGDGRPPFPIEMSTKAVSKNGRLEAVHCVLRDISERKLAEAELTLLKTSIEQATEIFIVTDPAGIIEYVNPAFESITGLKRGDAYGNSINILKTNQNILKTIINKVSKSGREFNGRLVHVKSDGGEGELEIAVSPIRNSEFRVVNIVTIARDVTSEANLEAQLRQAQKLESIGTLAGGIAHDFNNILSAIMGYTQIAFYQCEGNSKISGSLEKVLHASERARDLISQILSFSMPSESNPLPVKIRIIVKEVLKLLRASLPSTITIKQEVIAEKDTVLAEPTQIHQVIMNLCTNAHHAMREHGGILEIVLQNKLVAPDGDILIPDIIPGDYLVLSVKDTGSGMDAVTLEQIFNPYFTTKEKGEGTGLGLSVVHGIIKKHKGAIKVFSQQGLGTQFDIYLPLIEEKVVNEFIEEKSELPEGKGRILFVDDEEVLVEMGQEMLASLGYQVDSVVNSIKALEMFNRNPDKWDIVITDFTMPGMTGVKLATEILGIRPDIPVLICTGYSEGVTIKTDAKQGIRKVLMKPVAMGDFAKAIKEFLP